MNSLPQFLLDMLAAVPQTGGGVHQWMFKVSRHLHAHRSRTDIISLITAATDGCGRRIPAREIEAAVDAAEKVKWTPNDETASPIPRPAPKWPAVNTDLRSRIIAEMKFDLASLWEASSITCTRDSTSADWIIDELFPGNPLICVGKSAYEFQTAPRENFRGMLSDHQLIVPSAMSALTGMTKDGKESAHCVGNTGPRMFLVTEFDSGTADEQAALIWHLRKFAPLVMVLSSGGKSLHAWWNCQGLSESIPGRFMRYAVSVGADHATWTRSQFVRMPQGFRPDKGRHQEVYYFKQGGITA